jgi:uncharacterized protein YhaN
MRIVQIDAAHFGALNLDKPLKLSDELNLWIDNNQAGKTTMLNFLEWMLYGPPTRRGAKDPAALKRWTPWSGGQASGRIVIHPELKDWPGEVLVSARFSDSFIQLSEYRTQKTIADKVAVVKSGEWNLGQLLLNLSRESFRQSLIAYQGKLTDLLEKNNLRQVLTADLGSLVENPDIAAADRILGALESPTFTLGSGASRSIREHQMMLTKELDILDLERRGLEQRLGEFKDLLTHRESVNTQLQQQERVLAAQSRQAQQLDLARNYYLLRISRPDPNMPDAAQLVQEHPEYQAVTAELERDVEGLAGQLEATEQQLGHLRNELSRIESLYSAELARASSSADSAVAIQTAQQLRDMATRIEAARADMLRAQERLEAQEQRIPTKVRQRFTDLDKLYADQRGNLAAIMEWQKETTAINERLAQLRDRRAELQILSRVNLPRLFYVGIVVLVIGALQLFSGQLYGPFDKVPWIIFFLCVILAWIFTWPYWKMRKATGPAATELRTVVNPAIEEQIAQLTAQDRKRRRFLEVNELERPAWDKLVDNIMEYTQLDMQLREQTAAARDLETIRRRLEAAWVDVGEILPLAPLNVDMEWLQRQLAATGGASGGAQALSVLEQQLAQLRSEAKRLSELHDSLTRAMADKLEPLGLGSQVKAGLRNALDSFRGIADRMRLLAQSKDRQSVFEDTARGLLLSEGEFSQQWAELSETDQMRIKQLASTRDGFESVCLRLQEVSKSRRESEVLRDSLRTEMDQVRDQLEQFGRIDREAEDVQKRSESARLRMQQVERWDAAVKVTSRIIDSLVNRAAQSIAPEVERALKQVLDKAPIRGLNEVRISKNLELEIFYAGAPAGLPAEELLGYLSDGAKQQLALALRLALARTASGRTDLPLILDEPLAELDDERARLAFDYIAQLAHNSQVIITTCHAHLYQWLAAPHSGVNMIKMG